MTVLGQHVGHRCEPLDDRRLRCHDCRHTLVITQPSQSTSTSQGDPPADQACSVHVGEWARHCGRCMADHLADERADQEHGHRKVEHQPTADVAARAAEARAVLPPRRSAAGLHPRLHDPDRLAAARAEIASREIIPVPAERLEQTPAGPT